MSSADRRRRALRAAERALEAAALSCFVLMLLATVAQVLFRYALHVPAVWTEEAARILFLIAMMLGIAIAAGKHEHIVVDFLFARLPPRPQAALGAAFDLAILAFLAILALGAVRMAGVTWGSAYVTIPWFHSGYMHLIQLLSTLLLAAYVLADLRVRLGILVAGEARARAPGSALRDEV